MYCIFLSKSVFDTTVYLVLPTPRNTRFKLPTQQYYCGTCSTSHLMEEIFFFTVVLVIVALTKK